MSKLTLKNLIKKIELQLIILNLKLQILLLKKKLTIPNLPSPKFIVVHHEGASNGFEAVNKWHKKIWSFKSSLGYYVGYHYYISIDGTLHQARRDNEEAAHCVEPGNPHFWNKNSLGICCQGNTNEKTITEEQSKTLKELLNKKIKEYNIPKDKILGHKEISQTSCPGQNLYRWLQIYKGRV